jgi:hypothetical protein
MIPELKKQNQKNQNNSRKSTGWYFFDPTIFVHAFVSSVKSKFSIIWGVIGLVILPIVMSIPAMIGQNEGIPLGIFIMTLGLSLLLWIFVWDIVNMVQLFSADHTLGVMNLEIRKGRRLSAIFFSRYIANKLWITLYAGVLCLIYLAIIELGPMNLHSWNALMVFTIVPVDIVCSCIFLFCFAFWRHRLAIGMESFMLVITLLSPVFGMIGQLGLTNEKWTEKVTSNYVTKNQTTDEYLGEIYSSLQNTNNPLDNFDIALMNDYYKFGYSFSFYDPENSYYTGAWSRIADAIMGNGIIATKDIQGKGFQNVTNASEADYNKNKVTLKDNPYLYNALTNTLSDPIRTHSNLRTDTVNFYINDNYIRKEDENNPDTFDESGEYTPIYSNTSLDDNEKPLLLKLNDDYVATHKIDDKSKSDWTNSILMNSTNVASRKKAALSQVQDIISWINNDWAKDNKYNSMNQFNELVFNFIKENLGIYQDDSYECTNGECTQSGWHYNFPTLGNNYQQGYYQMIGEQLKDWNTKDFANTIHTPAGLALYNQAVHEIFGFIKKQGNPDDNDNSWASTYVNIAKYRSTILPVPWAMTMNEWYHPYTKLSWAYRAQESRRLLFGMEQNFIYQYADYYSQTNGSPNIKDSIYQNDSNSLFDLIDPENFVVYTPPSRANPKTAEIYSVPGYNVALIVIGFTFTGLSFVAFMRRVKY